MSAMEALKLARTAGINLRLDGDDLVLEAAAPAATEIVDLLRDNKRDIVALLRPGLGGRSADEWHNFFDERAAIAEVKCGLSRMEAEARAMNRDFVCSPPGQCLACGAAEYAYEAILPFGVQPAGRAWLHSRCWPAWNADRKTQPVAALKTMGIVPPA